MMRLLTGALLVGACVSAHAKKAEAPKTPAELSIDHGYVRVSLPQWEYATEFSLRRSDAKKEVLAPKLTERMGPRSFGGWIPAGNYDVVNMNGVDGERYTPVTVRPGELTDLGVILRVPVGGYEYVLLPIRDQESEAESDAAGAALETVLKTREALRWQPVGLPRPAKYRDPSANLGLIADLLIAHDRKKNQPALSQQLRSATSIDALLGLAKAVLPPRTEEAGVDSAGNLYFGADLGQIRVRSTGGTWGALDTGTLTEITAVEVSGERIVAGDLRGGLHASDDGGKTWRRLHALDAKQAVFDIDRAGNRWLVMTGDFIDDIPPNPGFSAAPPGTPRGWSLGTSVHVYSGTQDDLSDLALVQEFPLQQAGAMHVRGIVDSYVGQVANGFYFINLKTLHRLDLETMQWSEHDVGHRVDSFRISRDGRLITAKRMQGAFSKLSVSSDNGASWTKFSRPPYTIYDAVFETTDSGTATRWNQNAFGVELEFYAYDPKVKDWRKSYPAPPECVQMLRDATHEQRYCLTNGGSILARQDGAWIAEFALE